MGRIGGYMARQMAGGSSTYQELHHQRKQQPSTADSSLSHDGSLSLLSSGMLTGLTCAGNQGYCDLVGTGVLSCPEDDASLVLLTSGF